VLEKSSKTGYYSSMKLVIGPPPSPNRKKYPFVASIRYKGLIIDIENLAGSTRSGVGPNGKPWKTLFKGAHYGEIRGSKGTDGDPLDVYLKAEPADTDKVYIVHQNFPGNHPTKAGQHDEDKCAIGASSLEEAKNLYLRHYDRKDYLRSITEMSFGKFKKYIFGEDKGEKVADMVAKLKKKKKKKRGAPFIRMRLKGAEMENVKLAEAYEQGVFMALEACGLVKEGAISLSALKQQTQGPMSGITEKSLIPRLTSSTLGKPTASSRIAEPAPGRGVKRIPAPTPAPKSPTVAGAGPRPRPIPGPMKLQRSFR